MVIGKGCRIAQSVPYVKVTEQDKESFTLNSTHLIPKLFPLQKHALFRKFTRRKISCHTYFFATLHLICFKALTL